MKYTLLENGIDSLKATSDSLSKFANDDLAERPYHHIKDAILSINHANEILFKCLLQQEQEHLIYRDINAFMDAKKVMVAKGLSNIMDTNSKSLHTVNLTEAMDRLQYICGYDINTSFQRLLNELKNFRNKLMHYELVFDDSTTGQIGFKIMKLYEMTEEFFEERFPNFTDLLDEARLELTYEDYYDQYADAAYDAHIESKYDFEADLMDLAESGRGGFGSGV